MVERGVVPSPKPLGIWDALAVEQIAFNRPRSVAEYSIYYMQARPSRWVAGMMGEGTMQAASPVEGEGLASAESLRRVIIVGGGVSAASMAIQLVRYTQVPLDISIIEQRQHVGPGLAYSTHDPGYRLNAPLDVHWIDPRRPFELRRWCELRGIFEQDPECFTKNGQVFLRRSDFGQYLSAQIDIHANDQRLGSTIRHIHDSATSARLERGIYRVTTRSHGEVEGSMLVVATGNPVPSLRAPFRAAHDLHPRIIGNPLESSCLDRICTDARVLVVGGGLTALDVVSTLVRRKHSGVIHVVSRRGLRPRPQSPELLQLPPRKVELSTIIPEFLAGQPNTVRSWTKALRGAIAAAATQGQNWYASFDSVRDVVWQLWPRLNDREKLRFLKRLRIFYDVHRFRTPPMTAACVADAEREGRVRYAAATLTDVEGDSDSATLRIELQDAETKDRQWHDFDFAINCSGLDAASAWRFNPFLQDLVCRGQLRLHPAGIGFALSQNCEAIDADGLTLSSLRVIGPPSSGAFGDPVAVPFIANQVSRILPDVLRILSSKSAG